MRLILSLVIIWPDKKQSLAAQNANQNLCVSGNPHPSGVLYVAESPELKDLPGYEKVQIRSNKSAVSVDNRLYWLLATSILHLITVLFDGMQTARGESHSGRAVGKGPVLANIAQVTDVIWSHS